MLLGFGGRRKTFSRKPSPSWADPSNIVAPCGSGLSCSRSNTDGRVFGRNARMSAPRVSRPEWPAGGNSADASFVYLTAAECLLLTLCMQEVEDRDPLQVGLLKVLMARGEGPIDPALWGENKPLADRPEGKERLNVEAAAAPAPALDQEGQRGKTGSFGSSRAA